MRLCGKFEGRNVKFRSGKFEGRNVKFRSGKFEGKNVKFQSGKFEGRNVKFRGGKFKGRNVKFRREKYEGGKFEGRNVKFRREKCKNSKFAVCILNGPNGPPYLTVNTRLCKLTVVSEYSGKDHRCIRIYAEDGGIRYWAFGYFW